MSLQTNLNSIHVSRRQISPLKLFGLYHLIELAAQMPAPTDLVSSVERYTLVIRPPLRD
jgi:hypothetical protein